MTKETLNVTIHNAETGEIVVKPMTADEIAVIENERLREETMRQEATTKAVEKIAVLAKLGLTAEEVAALLS